MKKLILLALLCAPAFAQTDTGTELAAANTTLANQLEDARQKLGTAGWNCVALDMGPARQVCFDSAIDTFELAKIDAVALHLNRIVAANALRLGLPTTATLAEALAAGVAFKEARIIWPEIMPVVDWSCETGC